MKKKTKAIIYIAIAVQILVGMLSLIATSETKEFTYWQNFLGFETIILVVLTFIFCIYKALDLLD